MNPELNPFSPGAGAPPPALAGREEILQKIKFAVVRVKKHRSEKSVLLVGLRGVGKTVLLNQILDMVEMEGYKACMIEAEEKKSLPELLLPYLKQILFSLNKKVANGQKVKKALRILKSFVNTVKIKFHQIEFSLDIDPEIGTADSGDLETDLTQLFLAIGDAAKEQEIPIAIIIDELQYLSEKELSALIMALHKIAQKSLPIIIFGAGLPQLVGHAGKAKTYAERLFDFPVLGSLNENDAAMALQEPALAEGMKFTDAALNEIFAITRGYPYFIQEWGYQVWNAAENNPIDQDAVKIASQKAMENLDQSFFRVRFDRLTAKEKAYLRALAELGSEPQRSGQIAKQMQLEINQAAPIRNSLIKKGMIYSPSHGYTAFTVPLFDRFMKRVMP